MKKFDSTDVNQKKNSKAFAIKSAVKAERKFRHKADLLEKKKHIPLVDRTPLEPPPIVVSIIGSKGVGKSTLIRCLIRQMTRAVIKEIKGPITVVAAKKRRVTFLECDNNINSMIDIAKISDLSLLLIDASFGFEVEIFEYLNICQTHGFPRIMGVLNHLDNFKNKKKLKNVKKNLKHRFWTEVYQGAKLFYLSGMVKGDYLKNEVKNLNRFISIMKFRPLQWRSIHPYLLVDRFEDLTNQNALHEDPKCDRKVSFYGYCRGSFFKNGQSVHLPGCGDYTIASLSFLPDPCPLAEKDKQKKRRSLNQKDRVIYAPFAGVGGILYDKDAVYIDLKGSHSHGTEGEDEASQLVKSIVNSEKFLDEEVVQSRIQLFADQKLTDSTTRPGSADNKLDEEDSSVESDDEAINDDDTDGMKENSENDEEDSQDDYSDQSMGEDDENHNKRIKFNDNSDDDDLHKAREKLRFDGDSDDDEEMFQSPKMAENLTARAALNYYLRQKSSNNIQALVYGDAFDLKEDTYLEEGRDVAGGLLKAVRKRFEDTTNMNYTLNSIECTKFPKDVVQDWNNYRVLDSIRDCFVTGKWEADEDAENLLKEEDEDLFGDFEDLEASATKENITSDKKPETDINKTEEELEAERRLKKEQKKKEFDAKYDEGALDKEEQVEKPTFYDEWKEQLDEQAKVSSPILFILMTNRISFKAQ